MTDRYDPWGQTPRFLHHKLYFVYLRSHRDLENDDDATDAVIELLGDLPELIAPEASYNTFANGFVGRAWSREGAEALATQWSDQLAKFDAWAIHDGFADIAESIVDGPTTQALIAARLSFSSALPLAQAFIVFHAADREPHWRFDPDHATDLIKSQWRVPCQNAFHFRNGRIVFAASNDPASIMARRMEGRIPRAARPGKHLKKEVEEIALYDGGDNDGLAYFSGGSAWRQTKIYDDEVDVDEDADV